MRVCDIGLSVKMYRCSFSVIAGGVGRVQCLNQYDSSDWNSHSGSGLQVAEILALCSPAKILYSKISSISSSTIMFLIIMEN